MSLFFGKKMQPLKDIEENIYSSVMVNRKEPEESTYHTPWSPSVDELYMDNFPVSYLYKFLSLAISDEVAPRNNRTVRTISSLSQNIFYVLHEGKRLTPKRILLLLLVKSLSNNTRFGLPHYC